MNSFIYNIEFLCPSKVAFKENDVLPLFTDHFLIVLSKEDETNSFVFSKYIKHVISKSWASIVWIHLYFILYDVGEFIIEEPLNGGSVSYSNGLS